MNGYTNPKVKTEYVTCSLPQPRNVQLFYKHKFTKIPQFQNRYSTYRNTCINKIKKSETEKI